PNLHFLSNSFDCALKKLAVNSSETKTHKNFFMIIFLVITLHKCKINMYRNLFLFLTFSLLVLTSCNNNPFDVDVSNVKTEPLKILRLDDDLFALNERNFNEQSEKIKNKYGIYYEHYLAAFLN